MRRREFLGILGGAAAWPVTAQAKQATPVIGMLGAALGMISEVRMAAFRQGLAEHNFVEGQNVSIVAVGAEGKFDRLPSLADELVRRHVNVIVVPQSTVAALTARNATNAIPIIFSSPVDPVKLGLVTSLSRPDANLTGVYTFGIDLAVKRVGLLRELVPNLQRIALLINPAAIVASEASREEVRAAARGLGLTIQVHRARTIEDIEAVFAALASSHPDALHVVNDAFLNSRSAQIAMLASRLRLPAIYPQRDFVETGGLISYGINLAETYRQMGVYAGRVLKGAKPTDLPVTRSTKFELAINIRAAKALGLTVPPALLARADEVIE